VRFLGWRADRADLLATADVCVFPSRFEPFGIVSIESWAAGVPLIASRAAGPGALIRDGEDGLLVPVDDAPALAAAIARLLADADLRRRLAAAGRRRYEAEFTEAAVVADYRALFERMVAEHAAKKKGPERTGPLSSS
jgi:glycosyltransferase involved in cell wall biosynthesis